VHWFRDSDLVTVAQGLLHFLDSVKELEVLPLPWLVYALSCHTSCDFILERTSSWSLKHLKSELSSAQRVTISIPLIRLLGNAAAASNDCASMFLKDETFPQLVYQLLNSAYEPICKETFLLVANIVNNPSDDVQNVLTSINFRCFLEKSVVRVSELFG